MQLFPDDVWEDMFSKVNDISKSQVVTHNDNILETVLDRDVVTNRK